MVFSLERFRREKPRPPFELGGILECPHEGFVLVDALGMLGLKGDAKIFAGLNPGDLVVVHVTDADHSSVRCDKVRSVYQTAQEDFRITKPHVARFAAFVQRVQRIFSERGLTEILTPSLVVCPGLEPSLEPFKIGERYLPTSPEIHLKKAMAQGFTDIFEIKNCFRKGEFSNHHQSEFLMLEWYRAFADLTIIEQDLRSLIATLAKEGWISGPEPTLQNTDFAGLFEEAVGYRLTPKTTEAELRDLCTKLEIHTAANDSFNDLFHRILIERIEAHLAQKGAVIVRRFPPSQAALAKLDSEGWADRFEFYWRGLEIANAFNEVTDSQEQMRRWEWEIAERKRLGTAEVPYDEELIKALRKGLPPSGGIALGLERLYMACAGVEDIKELRLFALG